MASIISKIILEEAEGSFDKDNNLDRKDKNEITKWIESLLWDVNEIVLQFNW